MKLTKEESRVLRQLLLGFGGVLLLGAIVVIVFTLRDEARLGPEQHEQVEVVWIMINIVNPDSRYHSRHVTFKFSDGLEQRYTIGYTCFNSIQPPLRVGDTGMLTFRPRIDLDPENPYRGRFVQFEHDSLPEPSG